MSPATVAAGQDNEARRGGMWPVRILTAAVTLNVMVLLMLAGSAHQSFGMIRDNLERYSEIYRLRSSILHLDEVLTMSARMAAATGDRQWEQRYQASATALDQAILRARQLGAPIHGEQAADAIDQANQRLVAVELRAFELVGLDQKEQAQELLRSPWYEAQKRAYADGLRQLDERLERTAVGLLEERQRRLRFNMLLILSSIPFLLVGWLVAFRALRRSHRAVRGKTEQLHRRTEELTQLNRTLDQRVAERTEEWRESQAAALKLMRSAEVTKQQVEQANEALRHEIEQRERAQRQLQELASFPEQNPDPVIELSAAGQLTYANSAAKAQFPTLDVQQAKHPVAAEALTAAAELARTGQLRTSLDLTVDHHDLEAQVIRAGDSDRIRVYVRDITDRKLAQRRVAVGHAATRILAESDTLDQAVPALLQAVCEALGWDVGGIWMVDRSASVLRCVDTWHVADCEALAFDAATRSVAFGPGIGTPGWVWKNAVPMWIPDLQTEPMFQRKDQARSIGLHSGLGFPILHRGEVIGVMEFFSMRLQQADEQLLKILSGIGTQVGQFMERRRLEQQRHEQASAVERNNAELLRRERVMQSLLEDLQTSKDTLEAQQASLQAANRRLEELSRVKDEFVATVSHELRTPLTAIKEGISLLLDEALGDINEEQRDFLHTVDENIDRLTELISNMLDLSKIEAGRLRLFRKRVAMSRLFTDILGNYRAMAGQRTLQVDATGAPDVFADPNRILQVLGNLVSNAVKFTPPDGTVTLTAQAANGHVVVSVGDSGMGIAEEDLPKLFKRFSQVGEGQGRPRGTGLGLALCKELVEMHKGSITVSSEPGKGSTFTVTLPTYTPQFTIQESFQELAELAKGEQDHVAVITLDCRPLFGPLVSALSDDGQLSEQAGRAEQLEVVVDYLRRHLHRGDTVLSLEPRWAVIFADADAAGVQAILHRLKGAMAKDMAAYAETPEQILLQFGAASFPEDGRDVHELLLKATGVDADALPLIADLAKGSHGQPG
jgi:signal transduction histidine kinase/PAS domain-containing protein